MPQSKRDRFNELMKERDDKAGKLQTLSGRNIR
jgi:hypothetical protein